jgi:DNA (cytosine-5)-methyltransferase 3A
MNVLGLYDGISCGSVALKNLGIENEYFSSEIDSHAIKIANKNFPNINQVGNIFDLNKQKLPKIDLICGGSPCTHWSIARKNREISIDGKGYELFYQYVRLLTELKPKYFLYENNYRINQEIINKISEDLNVLPVLIDSADFSAQNRKRFYWTNIPFDRNKFCSPKIIKDILENNVDKKYFLSKDYDFIPPENVSKNSNYIFRCGIITGKKWINNDKNFSSCFKQGNRVYSVLGKSCTVNSNGGGLGRCSGLYYLEDGKDFSKDNIRRLTPIECERLQCLPDNYTLGISEAQRYKSIGNGWTVGVISHILKSLCH